GVNMKKFIFILLIIFNIFASSVSAQWRVEFNHQPASPFRVTNLILYDDDNLRCTDFEKISFRYVDTSGASVNKCTFKDCFFHAGYFDAYDENDYYGSYFYPNCTVRYLSPRSLKQTKHYELKSICFDLEKAEYDNFDFSDFTISSYFRVRTEGAKFHNTWFKNAKIPQYLTQEQIKQTKNYQTGVFHGISFWKCDPDEFMKIHKKLKEQQIFQNLDISGMTFSFCELYGSFSGTNMTDTVFTESDLSTVEDLTLEQVKSTWNYKAGRMSLCKWPEYIEKALEEEEKAKAQEEKK
ncbi:MAG: hypothetical protein J6A23_03320, partial [Thermoguttaceae bacterium]|nr:hypothetical protein [Thermoguttaceae bacterium]